MIQIFDKKYKAISNIFVTTYDDNKYVFPSPMSIEMTIANEERNQKDRLVAVFNNYYESILVLDNYFSCFFYLLNFEFRIETMIIPVLQKLEDGHDMHGYKGIYTFQSENISINIGKDEIYESYKRLHNLIHV